MMIHSKKPVLKDCELGVSLISLMLGIALSSASMLAATSMLVSHQSAVSDLQDSIVYNRKIVTALSTVQKQIQSAGFGIDNPVQTGNQADIVIEFDPGTATNPARTSILWRYIDNPGTNAPPVTVCRGIIEDGSTIDDTETRRLRFVQTTSTDCNLTTPLANMVWNVTLGTLGSWVVEDQLVPYINANGTLFSFVLPTTPVICPAPGTRLMPNTPQYLRATISAPDFAELSGQSAGLNTFNVCLINT